jgi:hypothetical protein
MRNRQPVSDPAGSAPPSPLVTAWPVIASYLRMASFPGLDNSGSYSLSNSDAEVLPASSGVDGSQESPFSVIHTTSATPTVLGSQLRASVRRASGFVLVGYTLMWSSPTGSRVDDGLTCSNPPWTKEQRLTA